LIKILRVTRGKRGKVIFAFKDMKVSTDHWHCTCCVLCDPLTSHQIKHGRKKRQWKTNFDHFRKGRDWENYFQELKIKHFREEVYFRILERRIDSRRGRSRHRRCRHPHMIWRPNCDIYSRRPSLRWTSNNSLDSKGPRRHQRHLPHRWNIWKVSIVFRFSSMRPSSRSSADVSFWGPEKRGNFLNTYRIKACYPSSLMNFSPCSRG